MKHFSACIAVALCACAAKHTPPSDTDAGTHADAEPPDGTSPPPPADAAQPIDSSRPALTPDAEPPESTGCSVLTELTDGTNEVSAAALAWTGSEIGVAWEERRGTPTGSLLELRFQALDSMAVLPSEARLLEARETWSVGLNLLSTPDGYALLRYEGLYSLDANGSMRRLQFVDQPLGELHRDGDRVRLVRAGDGPIALTFVDTIEPPLEFQHRLAESLSGASEIVYREDGFTLWLSNAWDPAVAATWTSYPFTYGEYRPALGVTLPSPVMGIVASDWDPRTRSTLLLVDRPTDPGSRFIGIDLLRIDDASGDATRIVLANTAGHGNGFGDVAIGTDEALVVWAHGEEGLDVNAVSAAFVGSDALDGEPIPVLAAAARQIDVAYRAEYDDYVGVVSSTRAATVFRCVP